jgi:hypothetical protein
LRKQNSGSGEPRYGRQTLRSISCPLVSAGLIVLRPQRPGSPNLVSFPLVSWPAGAPTYCP